MVIKRAIIFLLLLTAIHSSIRAQVYYTKNGKISFFSRAPLENISADNNQVLSVLNISTGALQFSLLNNAFHFPKAKMEDDFNENYIESDKYPKSTFKGTITDVSSFSALKDGSYPVNVKGDLAIHGVSKNITAPGTITIKDGKISATAKVRVLLKDYKIGIPTIVTNKISESIEITVNCNYEKK
jgi:hypothetical protein